MTTPNTSILVADDEPDVRALVAANLVNAGFHVIRAEDGESALDKARSQSPALVVLDVMMPGMSGMEVCRSLKNDPATAGISVVLLTAKAEEVDRIVGLELGADDYVTKPFSPRELVLRVQSILRRKAGAAGAPGIQRIGQITIDRDRHMIAVGDRTVDLTVIEFKLLSVLSAKRGHVHSRGDLLSRVWGFEKDIETRTVDTHVRRLREKLGQAANQIQTVRGFGYRLDEE
jgi:DNA-binding response OmpR family regulator